MKNNIMNLIKMQEDVLILMEELEIEKVELEIINGQWIIKHWLQK